ncbi:MAG: hypothetical protein QOH91_1699 [Mycobacterium sp.]|nr:hypothetical protein [Mycobacterium sp.]
MPVASQPGDLRLLRRLIAIAYPPLTTRTVHWRIRAPAGADNTGTRREHAGSPSFWKATEYLMGNHTIAECIFRHDPAVMLHAPLRTVV